MADKLEVDACLFDLEELLPRLESEMEAERRGMGEGKVSWLGYHRFSLGTRSRRSPQLSKEALIFKS